MDTTAAYDLWSQVYDTDGNFLQALDTIEMKNLLPEFVAGLPLSDSRLKIVDLGCGTGRNTLQLLSFNDLDLVGLDASPSMLEVARNRLTQEDIYSSVTPNSRVDFLLYDMITQTSPPDVALKADAIISTLVIEHIPTEIFFDTASKILKPGGRILLTNMHDEMGSISQAGFIDPKTGQKIRPTSYAHTIGEILSTAGSHGFVLDNEAVERKVDQTLSKSLGVRAQKWIGVTVWFGMVLVRKHPAKIM